MKNLDTSASQVAIWTQGFVHIGKRSWRKSIVGDAFGVDRMDYFNGPFIELPVSRYIFATISKLLNLVLFTNY